MIMINNSPVFVYAAVNSGDQNITQGAIVLTWMDSEGKQHELNLSCEDATVIANELKMAVEMYSLQNERGTK